jgi:hypothetical protein
VNTTRKQTLPIIFFAVLLLLPIGCVRAATTATSSSPLSHATQKATTATSNAALTHTTVLPTGTDVAFQTVAGPSHLAGSYADRAAQIRLLADSQSVYDVFGWLSSYDADRLFSVDYQRYFVVVAFNGWRGGIGIGTYFGIERIWQDDATVYVQAHFDDGSATSLAMNSSQYQGVKIDRSVLAQSGVITFKLLDETGKERASAFQAF